MRFCDFFAEILSRSSPASTASHALCLSSSVQAVMMFSPQTEQRLWHGASVSLAAVSAGLFYVYLTAPAPGQRLYTPPSVVRQPVVTKVAAPYRPAPVNSRVNALTSELDSSLIPSAEVVGFDSSQVCTSAHP